MTLKSFFTAQTIKLQAQKITFNFCKMQFPLLNNITANKQRSITRVFARSKSAYGRSQNKLTSHSSISLFAIKRQFEVK